MSKIEDDYDNDDDDDRNSSKLNTKSIDKWTNNLAVNTKSDAILTVGPPREEEEEKKEQLAVSSSSPMSSNDQDHDNDDVDHHSHQAPSNNNNNNEEEEQSQPPAEASIKLASILKDNLAADDYNDADIQSASSLGSLKSIKSPKKKKRSRKTAAAAATIDSTLSDNQGIKPNVKASTSSSNATTTQNVNHPPPTVVGNNVNRKNYVIQYPFKLIEHQTDLNSRFLYLIKLFFLFLVNVVFFVPIVLLCVLVSWPVNFAVGVLFRLSYAFHLNKARHLSPHKTPEFLSPVELFWLYNSNLNKDLAKSQQEERRKNGDAAQQPPVIVYSGSGFKSTGACLMFVEGNMPKSTIKELISNRIIQANTRNGQGMFDRFTQRLLSLAMFGYVWVTCPNFNIDDHIIEPADSSSIRTNAELQAYVNRLIRAHKFRIDSPLWSVYYLKNFGQAEKCTVILFIFHQCFSDGLSLIRLFFKGVVDNRNAIEVKPRFAYFHFSLSLIKQFLFSWSKIAYYVCCKSKDKNPIHADYYNSAKFKNLIEPKMEETTTTHHRHRNHHKEEEPNNQIVEDEESGDMASTTRLVWSDPFDIILLNRLKLVTRSKMNDLLISIVSGIIRNYLQLRGVSNPKKMNCIMPVDLASNRFPFKLGNKSSLTSFSIPVNVEGCVPRLWYTKSTMATLKGSSDFLFIYFLISCMFYLLPNRLAYKLCACVLDKNTLIASTLGAGDSSLSTVSVCNRNVKSIIYFYPSVSRVSVSFSIMTYGDEVRLALVADSRIISCPEAITKEFNKQLTILADLLANRRLPGEVKMRVYRTSIPSGGQIAGAADFIPDEVTIEEMQSRMNEIQHELQVLTESMERLSPSQADFQRQRQSILIKTDRLKKEFRESLVRMQIRQSVTSNAIPSDDEDEMEPEEIVRLRSASIASRTSSGSTHRRHGKDSFSDYSASNIERPVVPASRKQSATNSRHDRISYSSGISNSAEPMNPALASISHSNLHIENEMTRQQTTIGVGGGGNSINNNNQTRLLNINHSLGRHHHRDQQQLQQQHSIATNINKSTPSVSKSASFN